MSDRRREIDLKIKRLIAIETDHRHALQRAEEDLRRDPQHSVKHKRRIEKLKRKIDKVLPKIRRQRELRAATK